MRHPFDQLTGTMADTNKKKDKKPHRFAGKKNGRLAQKIFDKYGKTGVPVNEIPALIEMITGEGYQFDHISPKLIDQLKIYYGIYPHNGGTNYCKGDGYFYDSIVNKFGSAMVDAAYRTVIKPIEDKIISVSMGR